jgi:hypothetical protein
MVRIGPKEEKTMVRKFVMAAALAGAAILVLPASSTFAGGMDEMSSQAGTLGAGAPRTGSGPGTNAGNPNLSNATGPGANPVESTGSIQQPMRGKRQATHSRRHHRSTVGSSSRQ